MYLDLTAPVAAEYFCRVHRQRAGRSLGRYSIVYGRGLPHHTARRNTRMTGHRLRYEILGCRVRISSPRARPLRKEITGAFPYIASAAMRRPSALPKMDTDRGKPLRSSTGSVKKAFEQYSNGVKRRIPQIKNTRRQPTDTTTEERQSLLRCYLCAKFS